MERSLLEVFRFGYDEDDYRAIKTAVAVALAGGDLREFSFSGPKLVGDSDLGLNVTLEFTHEAQDLVEKMRIMTTNEGIQIASGLGGSPCVPKFVTDIMVQIPPELEGLFAREDDGKEDKSYTLLELAAGKFSKEDYVVVSTVVAQGLGVLALRTERPCITHSFFPPYLDQSNLVSMILEVSWKHGGKTNKMEFEGNNDGAVAFNVSPPNEMPVWLLTARFQIPSSVTFQ